VLGKYLAVCARRVLHYHCCSTQPYILYNRITRTLERLSRSSTNISFLGSCQMERGGLRYSEGCMNLRNLRNEGKKVTICYWTYRLNLSQRQCSYHMRKLFAHYVLWNYSQGRRRKKKRWKLNISSSIAKLVEFIYLIRKKVCPFIIMSRVFRNRTFKHFRVWSLPQKKLHPFHMRTWMHPSLKTR
jgi:hypothetical protein